MNNIPKNSGFTPKEIFTRISSDCSFRYYHTFSSLVCILDPNLRDDMKIPNYKLRLIPNVYLDKSLKHTSNVSLVYNPKTNFILP